MSEIIPCYCFYSEMTLSSVPYLFPFSLNTCPYTRSRCKHAHSDTPTLYSPYNMYIPTHMHTLTCIHYTHTHTHTHTHTQTPLHTDASNIGPVVGGAIVGVVVLLVMIVVAAIIIWRFVVCTSHILTCWFEHLLAGAPARMSNC